MTARRSFIASLFALFLGIALPIATAHAQSKTPKMKTGSVKEFEARHKPGDTVAIVEGVVVTFSDFNSIMAGYLKKFVAESKNDVVDDSLYSVIVDSAWNRALSDILVEREIEKRKLSLSVIAVKDSLIGDPPDYLRRQFTDSIGTFRPERMRSAMDDPRNDTIVGVILEGERVRLETERLISGLAKKGASAEERQTAFAAWLRKAKRTAKIEDRRTRFGFY